MASLNRIVLLSTWGDEMFSGKSLLSEPPGMFTFREADRRDDDDDDPHVEFHVEDDDEEAVPETLRSSVFVRLHEPASRPIIVNEVAPSHVYMRAADDYLAVKGARSERDEDAFSAAAADTPTYLGLGLGVAADDHLRAEDDHRAA